MYIRIVSDVFVQEDGTVFINKLSSMIQVGVCELLAKRVTSE